MASNDFKLNKLLDRISEELKLVQRESRQTSNDEHIISKRVSEQRETVPMPEESIPD